MQTKTFRQCISGVTVAVLLCFSIGSAEALVLTRPGGTPNGGADLRDDFSGTLGNVFTVGANDVLINALGFEDAGGDGLASSHSVELWDAGGTLLRSATVASGTSAELVQSWRFASVATFTLLANTTYVIGAETVAGSGDSFTDGVFDPAFGLDPAILSGSALSTFAGGSFSFPSNNAGGSGLRWGTANVTFFEAAADELVEPGSIAIIALGLLGMGLARRRKTA